MSTPKAGRHFASGTEEKEDPAGVLRGGRDGYPSLTNANATSSVTGVDTDEFTPISQSSPVSSSPSSGPINPLVAAREAAVGPVERSSAGLGAVGASGSPSSTQASPSVGKSFDISFAERKGNARHTLLVLIVVIAVILVIAAAAFFIVRGRVRASATENILAAIERISDADVVITPLDEAIASEISTSTVSGEVSNSMLSSTTASNALTDALAYAEEAGTYDFLLSEEQRDVIDAIELSVAARRTMIEIGRTLLSADSTVSSAIENLDAAYASIASANEYVQQSHAAYQTYADTVAQNGDTSGIDLWAIVEIDNQAVACITSAQASVAAAKEAFPSADYTALENYLINRLNELNLYVQFDTAVANGDEDTANSMIDLLNEASAVSTTAAALVPAASEDVVRSAYASVTSSQSEQYESARAQCVENDEIIRDYLGTSDESFVAMTDESSSSETSVEGSDDVAVVTDTTSAEAVTDASAAATDQAVIDDAAATTEGTVEAAA